MSPIRRRRREKGERKEESTGALAARGSEIWDPWTGMEREIQALRRELLEPLFGGPGRMTWGAPDWRVPPVDIRETDGSYEIRAELPGIQKEQIQLSLVPGRLEIRADAEEESEGHERGYRYRESSRRAFYRALPLPEDADTDAAQARMRDGVLEVELPRRETTSTRRTLRIQ